MAPPASPLVKDIEAALDAARGFAIGLQHEALAASHGRIDELVRALVAQAPAAGPKDMPEHRPEPMPEHKETLALVRRAIAKHQELLLSLHDAVQATPKRASHTPPVGYGHSAQMQGGGARPLLTTRA